MLVELVVVVVEGLVSSMRLSATVGPFPTPIGPESEVPAIWMALVMPKSVIRSLPLPKAAKTNVSLPPPPVSLSSPGPPAITSLREVPVAFSIVTPKAMPTTPLPMVENCPSRRSSVALKELVDASNVSVPPAS